MAAIRAEQIAMAEFLLDNGTSARFSTMHFVRIYNNSINKNAF